MSSNSAFSLSAANGSIIQVVQTQISALFSTSSGTYVDIPGLAVAITPASTTNKILIMATINGSSGGAAHAGALQLVRDATPINLGPVNGSNILASAPMVYPLYTSSGSSSVINYLDSPASIAAITYKVQVVTLGAATAFIGETAIDTSANYATYPCTIIAMEVKA